MHSTAVTTFGFVDLGPEARALGYVPGALVDVITTSAKSFLVVLNDQDTLTYEIQQAQRALADPSQNSLE